MRKSFAVPTEQIDHHAFVGQVEMREQDKGDAGIHGQRRGQLSERLETAGGGTDPDDRKAVASELKVCPRLGAGAPIARRRRRPLRSGSRRPWVRFSPGSAHVSST
jgi:hypothetical protein